MFVSFTKTLKKMSGFRLGFGVRVNKRNAPLWCFAMLFAGMFYLMWYMIIGAGWCLYFFLWAFYKIYYYLFKGIAVGCKKLYRESDGIGIDGRLETCEYEGAPAVRVFAEDELIGYVRKSDLSQMLPIVDRVDDVTITIDRFEDNEKIYNAEARVVYTK